jgi:hypothetical protein
MAMTGGAKVVNNSSDNVKHLAGLLLGPAGPELGCEECFTALDVYVELELAGADADGRVPGMRAHLQGCAACRSDHASLLALLQGGPELS